MLLGDLKDKSTNDTSLTKSGTVYVVPPQVLNSEELSDMRRVVTCERLKMVFRVLLEEGEMRSHFRFDPPTRLGGCLSVDISGPTFQESGPLLMIHRSSSREKHDIFWLLIIKTILQKKSRPSCSENTRQQS